MSDNKGDDGVDERRRSTIESEGFIQFFILTSFHHRHLVTVVMDPPILSSLNSSPGHSSSSSSFPDDLSSSLNSVECQQVLGSGSSLKDLSNNQTHGEDVQQQEEIRYRPYGGEHEIDHVMRLVETELSEPYTVYTYRYFLHQWPNLAYFAYSSLNPALPIGIIVCKQEMHRMKRERGYIAMLSVDKQYRKRKIASRLVEIAIEVMTANGSEEIALETEFDNLGALALYSSMGFMKEKRLFRFYLNGKDAHRLILPVLNPRRREPTRPLNMVPTDLSLPPPQHPSRIPQEQNPLLSATSLSQSSIPRSPWPEDEREGSHKNTVREKSEDSEEFSGYVPASFGIV